MYVSRYSNKKITNDLYVPLRISIGAPRWRLGYKIVGAVKELMPFGLLDLERAEYEERYRAQLEKIGVGAISKRLESLRDGDKNVVLLCYEDIRKPGEWCHRTLFSLWWKEKTGEGVGELEMSEAKQGVLF